MARCAAIKANGERCRLDAKGKQSVCWAHAPENAVARRKRASRGGKAKANQELPSIKALLEDLTEQVLETGRAAVANQLINTRLRAIELGRKIKETDELEARIEALEQPQQGGRQWGA
jgi:hypothetical protein